ncbi:MAG: hypothetical protein MHMPM18_004698 [Marteilia pararefringens]
MSIKSIFVLIIAKHTRNAAIRATHSIWRKLLAASNSTLLTRVIRSSSRRPSKRPSNLLAALVSHFLQLKQQQLIKFYLRLSV